MCYVQIAMAAVALYAGAKEASAQRAAGNANAQVSENNARLSDQNAKDTQVLAVRDQQQSAWRTRALIGQQKVAAAANGLDMDIGSPLDIMGETAMFGQADQDAIGANAARQAWGFQGDALNYRNQGTIAKWSGQAQSKATILRSVSGAANSFSSYGGAFGSKSSISPYTTGTINNGSGMRGYA